MRTIWTGTELVIEIGHRELRLDTEETQEFEEWVKDKVNRCNGQWPV